MRAIARAPASIGNVGVGFDIMGLSFNAAWDQVTAERQEGPGVRLGRVDGLVDHLPDSPRGNTALAAADALLGAMRPGFGVRLHITKGVPMSAGMGGSAASAVAAVAAVNALLPEPLAIEALLPFAMEGERVSADPPPWDNVIASLLGGLVLAARQRPASLTRLDVPAGIETILFHPRVEIETRAARALLARQVPLAVAVEHGRRVAAFVAGCARGDAALIRLGMEDVLVEPQRRRLFPLISAVQEAAAAAGALGCSFSGSGPSIFAWVETRDADRVEAAMADVFAGACVSAKAYRAPLEARGVEIVAEAAARC